MNYKTHKIGNEGIFSKEQVGLFRIPLTKDEDPCACPGDMLYDRSRLWFFNQISYITGGCSYGDCTDYGRGTG